MNESTNTLDPPGSIVVIGGGPLAIEASLYGRFLGYDVTLVMQRALEDWMPDRRDEDLPVLPDRCLSSLARSALDAQNHELGPQSLPMTVGEWIEKGLQGVCETDLLRGRVRSGESIQSIERVPVEDDEECVPDDFRVVLQTSSIEAEAVILVGERNDSIEKLISGDQDYVFRITPFELSEMESSLVRGYHAIASVFAGLADREELDLYRPKRG